MSARVVAVTTTACSSEKPDGSAESLPAAITAMAPLDHAYSTASQNAQPSTPWSVPPPRLRLMTSAPWSAAQRIAGGHVVGGSRGRAAVGAVAAVLEHPDRQEASVGRHAGHPRPLPVAASAMPATWVPWPLSSWPEPGARRRVPVRADAAGVAGELRREVLVPEVDARVDHRDRDALTGAAGPRPWRTDALEPPLEALLEHGIVRDRLAGVRRRRAPTTTSPAQQRTASDRTDRRIPPSSVRNGARRRASRRSSLRGDAGR